MKYGLNQCFPKTDEEITPDQKYKMSGNRISVRTLALNLDFEKIKEQLDKIAEEHFGEGDHERCFI